jgi:heme A synthase
MPGWDASGVNPSIVVVGARYSAVMVTRSTVITVSRMAPGILRPARSVILTVIATVAVGIIAVSGAVMITAADDHAAVIITTVISAIAAIVSAISIGSAPIDATRQR